MYHSTTKSDHSVQPPTKGKARSVDLVAYFRDGLNPIPSARLTLNIQENKELNLWAIVPT